MCHAVGIKFKVALISLLSSKKKCRKTIFIPSHLGSFWFHSLLLYIPAWYNWTLLSKNEILWCEKGSTKNWTSDKSFFFPHPKLKINAIYPFTLSYFLGIKLNNCHHSI